MQAMREVAHVFRQIDRHPLKPGKFDAMMEKLRLFAGAAGRTV